MKPSILIVADVPSPHQNVFFDALSCAGQLDVEILFCRSTMPGRAWSGAGPQHTRHSFLSPWPIAGLPTNPGLLPRVLAQPGRLPILIGYYLPGLLLTGAALSALGRPWVFWTDTLPAPDDRTDARARLRDAARAFFLRRSRLCLTTGEAGRAALLAHGVEPERAFVSPFVVDQEWIASEVARLRPGRAALRASWGVAPDAKLLLFVGQLIRRKGLDVLLEALGALGAGAGRLHLLVVGEGPESAALRAQAERLGLARRVTFLPYRDNAGLPELWAAADAFVLPARFDAWPVVVVEALAAGLPVLGTEACGSVRDLVRENESGWRCAPEDVAALASALAAVAALDQSGLAALSAGAQRAAAPLSPRAAADAFSRVVAEALRPDPRKSPRP